MRVTYQELLTAQTALTELVQITLPITGALHVRRLITELNAVLADFEATRIELLRRHARLDERGELILDAQHSAQFEDALARQAFEREYQGLVAESVEIQQTLCASDLTGTEIKPRVLLALGPLLEDA